jgi:hypothetical protein
MPSQLSVVTKNLEFSFRYIRKALLNYTGIRKYFAANIGVDCIKFNVHLHLPFIFKE